MAGRASCAHGPPTSTSGTRAPTTTSSASAGSGRCGPGSRCRCSIPLTVVLVRRRSLALRRARRRRRSSSLVQPYRWWARFTIPLMARSAPSRRRGRRAAAPRAVVRTSVRVGGAARSCCAGVALASLRGRSGGPRARRCPARESSPRRRAARPSARSAGCSIPEYASWSEVPGRRDGRRGPRGAGRALRLSAVRPRAEPRGGLPGRRRPAPPGAWVVTGAGRPLDRALRRRRRFTLAARRATACASGDPAHEPARAARRQRPSAASALTGSRAGRAWRAARRRGRARRPRRARARGRGAGAT